MQICQLSEQTSALNVGLLCYQEGLSQLLDMRDGRLHGVRLFVLCFNLKTIEFVCEDIFCSLFFQPQL